MSRRAKETTRREQQLGDSTQHRAEQELGQTQVRGRDRGRGGEASEPLSEHQQEASIKASTGCFKSDM